MNSTPAMKTTATTAYIALSSARGSTPNRARRGMPWMPFSPPVKAGTSFATKSAICASASVIIANAIAWRRTTSQPKAAPSVAPPIPPSAMPISGVRPPVCTA